jgi:hypothetical protein
MGSFSMQDSGERSVVLNLQLLSGKVFFASGLWSRTPAGFIGLSLCPCSTLDAFGAIFHLIVPYLGSAHGQRCPGAAMRALAAENEIYVGWELAFAIFLHEEEITPVVKFWFPRSSGVTWQPHASKAM